MWQKTFQITSFNKEYHIFYLDNFLTENLCQFQCIASWPQIHPSFACFIIPEWHIVNLCSFQLSEEVGRRVFQKEGVCLPYCSVLLLLLLLPCNCQWHMFRTLGGVHLMQLFLPDSAWSSLLTRCGLPPVYQL